MYRVIFVFYFLFSLNSAQAQDIPPSLEKDIGLIGMTYTYSEYYSIVFSDYDTNQGKYACEDKSCPLRKLGLINAEFVSSDKQCKVFIYVLGADNVRYGKMISNNPDLFGNIASMSYNRIKSNFKYGRRGLSATEQEIEDIKMMLTYYPQDSAKAIFNADYMLAYPYNMEGEKCQDKFSWTRAIVAGKNGLDIFVYFVLTNKSIKDFDKYLSDFKGILWFEEKEDDDN